MRLLLPLMAALGLAACATSPDGPARSTGQSFNSNGRELETPNSLPPGFTTNHPMAPATGVVGSTRVGN